MVFSNKSMRQKNDQTNNLYINVIDFNLSKRTKN